MSYDLFLKSDSSALTAEQFASYFSRRDCYTADKTRASYENEDTGVYFVFYYGGDDEDDSVAFNLNYFRPHFFGLEAAPELAEFVTTFNLSIGDPQTNGPSPIPLV